ncbi:MAG: CHRD domain-containing protein [Chryseosolibacter sp.]
MKIFLRKLLMASLILSALMYFPGCDNDDDPEPQLTGDSKTFDLFSVSNPAISGTVTFAERDDDKILITLDLSGTQAGNTHPAHIHANAAAEGGGIVLDLTSVDGATGKSETVVNALNDGTALSYEDLLAFDGYVNVHMSSSDLGTLVAQGDIGENELTGDSEQYTLNAVSDPAISGTATFSKRVNGQTLVSVDLTGTPAGDYASHIHANSAAETGGITIDLSNVDGTTGRARTNVTQRNDGTAITYEELLQYNGYLNVHSGASLLAQGDIGGNELTGDTKVYQMSPVALPSVTGTTTFSKRKNGNTLVTVALQNTETGASYPSHIHANTVAEGGGIVINLNNVDGTTGLAKSNVKQMNDGTPMTYDQLLEFNGYLNVHGAGSFIAQADIGQNGLTGDKKEYVLNELSASGVSGTATFEKRSNGKTQITLSLTGTVDGGDHPAHIHANNAATGGGIVLDLKNVNGATGKSVTSANALKDGTAITYDELINYNGHINVHLSPANLATRIAQGNIGSNAP